jgi:hypothetical protein
MGNCSTAADAMLQAPTQQLRQMEPVIGSGGQSQLAKGGGGHCRRHRVHHTTAAGSPREKEAGHTLGPSRYISPVFSDISGDPIPRYEKYFERISVQLFRRTL